MLCEVQIVTYKGQPHVQYIILCPTITVHLADGLSHYAVVQLAVNSTHTREPSYATCETYQPVQAGSLRSRSGKYLAALHDTKCRRHVLRDSRHCSICMHASLITRSSQLALGPVMM